MPEQTLYNPEAEALVLAAIVRYPEDYWSINDVSLRAEDFLGTENRRVMKAIESVVADRKPPETPLILEEVRLSGNAETGEYIQKLLSTPSSVSQSHEHARIVKGLSASRALASAGARIIEIARSNRSDYDTAIAEAESALFGVKRVLPPTERGTSAADILDRMSSATRVPNVPIRFAPSLQTWTNGLEQGHFWVIGGFSSVGKSAVAVNLALDVLRDRGKVPLIMSLEMTAETYMTRFESVASGVPMRSLKSGVMLPMDHGEKLAAVRDRLRRSTLQIDDTVRTIEHIRSRATRMKETKGLDVLFVDFIQNVYVKGDEFADARAVALELQNIAKDLSCTVVGFSQVSNEMAKRDADGADRNFYSFKGHGAIRDAADVAIMLRRDRISASPVLNVSVVKNRHDQVGEFACLMQLETGKIQEIERENDE